jgi:hypothetical protein
LFFTEDEPDQIERRGAEKITSVKRPWVRRYKKVIVYAALFLVSYHRACCKYPPERYAHSPLLNVTPGFVENPGTTRPLKGASKYGKAGFSLARFVAYKVGISTTNLFGK